VPTNMRSDVISRRFGISSDRPIRALLLRLNPKYSRSMRNTSELLRTFNENAKPTAARKST